MPPFRIAHAWLQLITLSGFVVATRAAESSAEPTRAAVLSVGTRGDEPDEPASMPGLHITADDLIAIVPDLRKERIEIVVLRLDAEMIWLREAFEFADAIDNVLDAEFRVVLWVEHATGAAAAIAMAGDEIVMTSDAEAGHFTTPRNYPAWVHGYRSWEEPLEAMEEVARRNSRPVELARAMVVNEPLSYTRRATNSVDWCLGLDGEAMLSDGSYTVAIDAAAAEACAFSIGTCDDYHDLGAVLGLHEVEWAGQRTDIVPWPVAKAERRLQDRVAVVDALIDEMGRLHTSLVALGEAHGAETRERAAGIVRRMRQLVHEAPSLVQQFGFANIEEFDAWAHERLAENQSPSRAADGL